MKKRAFRHVATFVILAFWSAGCTASNSTSYSPSSTAAMATEVVTVYADQDIAPRSVQGFTYFGDDLDQALVAPLALKHWRLSVHASSASYAFFKSFNPRITYVLSDAYAAANGGYDNAKPWLNWPAFDDFVRQTVQEAHTLGLRFDYWDVWNEPDGFWRGTRGQYLEMLSRSIAAIRSVDPAAKIVAPSQSSVTAPILDDILGALRRLGVSGQLNAIAWHEFGMPEDLPGHVQYARNYFRAHANDFCQPQCPEIHINEFSAGEHDAIPGWALGWLYYLERANVDWSSKACWQIDGTSQSACGHGLAGLFAADGRTPQHTYWVYRAYGELPRRRVRTKIAHLRTVALAARNDAARELRILVAAIAAAKISVGVYLATAM